MNLSAELKDALHLVDLRQVEVIQEMAQQVQTDLQGYWELGQAIAVAKQRSTHKKLNLAQAEKVTEEQIAKAREEVTKEQEKQLMAIKAAVFNATNTLRQLHERRQNMITATQEQATQPDVNIREDPGEPRSPEEE